MNRSNTPITIIADFLGAGKTTLLNHILHNINQQIAVLINDFGSINIDAQLIVSIEDNTVSLTNGCICCTIRDDLVVEIVRLIERPTPPEHIIIEASGVSDPQSILMTLQLPEIKERKKTKV